MSTIINLINDNEIQALLDTSETYIFYVCRNTSISTNQDLRRHANTPTNQSPYVVPYDSTIEYLIAGNNNTGASVTWDAKLLVNGVEQASFNVDNTANNDPKTTTISVAVSQDDLIRLRFENAGTSITRPQITIIGRKT